MRPRMILVLFVWAMLAMMLHGGLASAQAPEIIKTAQKLTTELMVAEKAFAAATNALQAAKNSLDTNLFNSPAWNARVSAEQLKAAKAKYDKAGPKEKEDALELYELAQELAEKRKAELEAAEKLLPQREAALKAVGEKYPSVLKTAEKIARPIKALVRQAENDLAEKLRLAKVAAEKAAFTKAKADKSAKANAEILKAMADLAAADKAVREATAAEKAVKDYAAALQAVVKHIPSIKAALANSALLKASADLVDADKAVQEAAAAVQKAKNELQIKTKVARSAADKAQTALAKVDTATAKIAAKKAADNAQALAAKAETSRLVVQKALDQKTAEAERVGEAHATALKAALNTIIPGQSLGADKAVIAKAMADKEVEIKKDNDATAREAAAAKADADKADATRAAADKIVVAQTGVRQALEKALRQRYYRELSVAHVELTKIRQSSNDKFLQPKIAALNKTTLVYKEARAAAAEAASALAAAQAALQKAPAKEKKAAEKLVKVKEAAWAAAEDKVAAAKAARDRARDEKVAEDDKLLQNQEFNKVAYAKVAVAKAAAQGGLKPLADSAWDYAKARHLLVRAGFGGTPDEVARLHALGLHRAVDQLVNYKKYADADLPFTAYPKERPLAYEKGLPGNEQAIINARRQQKQAQQIQNMRNWWMRRMIESPRPLEEKLTLFWHGHFAVQYSVVADSYFMYLQNQLFRDNAAGNFATLLHGITHDAAMLNYLNNDTNVKGRPNENLAREIMELFGMGRDQGYTEIDIRQGARALTGYTYDFWTGQFRFVESRHDPEPKTIFGKTGNWCGDDFAALILETPYPAKFIAKQMYTFFVSNDPSLDTIEALADVLRLNNYELAPMLENLFSSEEFYSAQAMGTQIKGPLQLLVGLHRDLGLKDANLPYLVTAANNMGQYLFEPPNVFGWPAGRTWINSTRIFIRYNALAEILETVPRGGKSGVDVVGTLLAGKKFQNHAEVVDYLVRSCLNVPLSEAKRQALIEFLNPLPSPAQWEAQAGPVNARLTRLLAILICSPEYQLT